MKIAENVVAGARLRGKTPRGPGADGRGRKRGSYLGFPRGQEKFYGEVLGLKVDPKRPASVPAPGVWYDFVGTQIHVIAGPKAYGEEDQGMFGGGNVDHFAVRAVGYDAWRAHLEKHSCDYRQNTVKAFGQWQLFTRDPNGVIIELQFIAADEPAGSKGPDGTKQYRFGYF